MTDRKKPESEPPGGQILIFRDGAMNLQVRVAGGKGAGQK